MTVDELVRSMPYPLGWKLGTLVRDCRRFDEGEPAPQLPFDLFALMSALLRTTTIVLVQQYVSTGGTDAEVNRLIVEALGQALVDEKWLQLARSLTKRLKSRKDPLVEALDVALEGVALEAAPARSKGSNERRVEAVGGDEVEGAQRKFVPRLAAKVRNDLEYLIALRNDVVHGERVDPGYIRHAVTLAAEVITRFEVLAKYRLVVRTADGGYALEGDLPTHLSALDAALPLDEPCLVPRDGDGAWFSLSPLMRFRQGTGGGQLAIDELFFLNAGAIERLSYVAFRLPEQLDAKSLGSYEAFRELMKKIPAPELPKDTRLDFAALVAGSTRFFVGREGVLAAVEGAVRERPAPYAVVRALPGMGKTSLLARLHQEHPPARLGDKQPGDRWCFHFCGNADGRNSPVVMMRSLMAQASDAVGFDLNKRNNYLKSTDLKELRDGLFPALLAEVAKHLNPGERLVLVVDALDEGFGSEDPIASVLPRVLPDNVIAIVSWRVDESNTNARVEEAFRQVEAGARHAIEGANPLRGLTRQNVSDFIAQVRRVHAEAAEDAPLSDFAPADSVLEAVWNAAQAEGGADPFYLRFLAQGADTGTIDLDRAESVPQSLDDAFEDTWLALPTDHDFALQRLLLYLGILREPGTDPLLSELLTRERPDHPLRPDDIAALRIAAGKLLAYDGDRYTLFHDRFRRFLVGDQKDPLDVALAAE